MVTARALGGRPKANIELGIITSSDQEVGLCDPAIYPTTQPSSLRLEIWWHEAE